MKRSTLEWLKSAQEDLIVIECVMDNRLATGAASFHVQQCSDYCLTVNPPLKISESFIFLRKTFLKQ